MEVVAAIEAVAIVYLASKLQSTEHRQEKAKATASAMLTYLTMTDRLKDFYEWLDEQVEQ